MYSYALLFILVIISFCSPTLFASSPYFLAGSRGKYSSLFAILVGCLVSLFSFLAQELISFVDSSAGHKGKDNLTTSVLIGIIVSEMTVLGLPAKNTFPPTTSLLLGLFIFYHYHEYLDKPEEEIK